MTKVATVQAQQKWDYCVESRRTENAILLALVDLGQRGWELVNVLHYKDPKGETAWTAFLKRPSVGQASAPVQVAAASKPAEAAASQPEGFDLSGDEFQIKPA